jgi:hypothetical protein
MPLFVFFSPFSQANHVWLCNLRHLIFFSFSKDSNTPFSKLSELKIRKENRREKEKETLT